MGVHPWLLLLPFLLPPEDGRHPYWCWLLLFQNKVLDVDGVKVKLQVRLQECGAGDTRERLGSMTSACCHRSGTQLVRSGSEVSPMPTTEMLMVSPSSWGPAILHSLGYLLAWGQEAHRHTMGQQVRVMQSHPITWEYLKGCG